MASLTSANMLEIDAEYCTLRAEAAVQISKELDPVQAAPLLCAGVTLFNGCVQP